jgi:NTP pyrophosphatase (non-canonical NTP hydrolase)
MSLNDYRDECRKAADRWYYHPVTGKRLTPNLGERLMLIVSEISEAMEGARKDLMDCKLPHRKMLEVEIVDALIRIFDLAGEEGLDLEGAYREKLAFNAVRPDHTHEARAAEGGKKW